MQRNRPWEGDMKQQTELWYSVIGPEYNTLMIQLCNAIFLRDEWVGDAFYDEVVAKKKDLLKSVGQENISCGILCSFEKWVKEQNLWVQIQVLQFNGMVPAELEDKILRKQRGYTDAFQQACEEFDPSLWFSIAFMGHMKQHGV